MKNKKIRKCLNYFLLNDSFSSSFCQHKSPPILILILKEREKEKGKTHKDKRKGGEKEKKRCHDFYSPPPILSLPHLPFFIRTNKKRKEKEKEKKRRKGEKEKSMAPHIINIISFG